MSPRSGSARTRPPIRGTWVDQVRQAVRFADGLATMLASGAHVPLEVGPGATLAGLCRRASGSPAGPAALTSMPAPADGAHASGSGAAPGEIETMMDAVAQLWASGVDIDWEAFHDGRPRQRVPLPTYPFERTRFWIDPPAELASPGPARQAAQDSVSRSPRRDRIDRWLLVPRWRADAAIDSASPLAPTDALVFVDRRGAGEAFAGFLRSVGTRVVEVRRGIAFGQAGDRQFAVGDGRSDYDRLIGGLRSAGGIPSAAFHFWSLDVDNGSRDWVARRRFLQPVVARTGDLVATRWRSRWLPTP